MFWHWLFSFFGLDNGSGAAYLWWSGIGSDLGEFAILGSLVAVYRHHTCHVDGCWRLGKHPHTQDGVGYVLCRKHHPDTPGKVTAGMMKPGR